MVGLIVVGAALSSQLVARIGARPLITFGPLLAAGGMFWLSRITEHSTYAGGLLGPMMLTGLGMGLTFVPLSLVALAKVPNKDTGVASSLLNTGQQVGGSIGLAILGTVAWSAVASNTKSAIAATHGAHLSTAAQTAIGNHALAYGFGQRVPGVGRDLAPRGGHRAGDDPDQAGGHGRASTRWRHRCYGQTVAREHGKPGQERRVTTSRRPGLRSCLWLTICSSCTPPPAPLPLDEFTDWYDNEHVPARLALRTGSVRWPGSARRTR